MSDITVQQARAARHRDMNRDIGDDTNERSEAVNRTVEGKVLARGLAAGQTLYRLMGYRLGPLLVVWSTNPGSEGLTDHSPGGLMLHHPGHVPSHRDPSGDRASVL